MISIGQNINQEQIILHYDQKIEDKKVLKEARTIFNSLKSDLNSVLFSEEKIDNRLLKKLKN